MIGNRAVGSVAVQLARNLYKASHVVGIAGTDDKCEWLKKIGAHSAVSVSSQLDVSNLTCTKQLQKRFVPCPTGGRYGRSRKCSV
jgi:NADPH-dependent curcumin reductase CurA